MIDPLKAARAAILTARRTFADGGSDDGIDVWHGTPHTFPAERLVEHPTGQQEYIQGGVDRLPDVAPGAKVVQDYPLGRFKSEAIGSGEGAQAYGHGIYQAKSKGVAEDYRKKLSSIGSDYTYHWKGNAYKGRSGPESHAISLAWHDSPQTAKNIGKKGLKDAISGEPYAIEMGGKEYWQKMLDTANSIKSKKEIEARQGNLYHSRIHAHPDHFLDWDKPLSEQSEHVQNAIKSFYTGDIPVVNKYNEKMKGGDYYQHMTQAAGGIMHKSKLDKAGMPSNLPGGTVERLSKYLKTIGIPGIRYLDQGSRGAGEGTHNYVVFDPKDIEIMKRYAQGGEVYHGHAPGHRHESAVDHALRLTQRGGFAKGGAPAIDFGPAAGAFSGVPKAASINTAPSEDILAQLYAPRNVATADPATLALRTAYAAPKTTGPVFPGYAALMTPSASQTDASGSGGSGSGNGFGGDFGDAAQEAQAAGVQAAMDAAGPQGERQIGRAHV